MSIGLGRLLAKDERDRTHVMPWRAAAASLASRYWHTPAAFDQGATSQCVAYAGVRYLVSAPTRNKPIGFSDLYRDCQKADEWPGEDYDGTTVRALFKTFKARGLVSGYQWAFDAKPVIDHLLMVGPVVMGTIWSDAMANIGSNGYLTVNADLSREVEGHAWCAIGANRKRRNPDGSLGAVRAVNSWGVDWGPSKGRFWVSFSDIGRLIAADGEACVAKEIKGV